MKEGLNAMSKKNNNLTMNVVRFTKFDDNNKKSKVKLLGFAVVNINGVVITGIRLLEGKNGRFVDMPSQKNGDEYFNTVWLDFGDKSENKKGYDELLAVIEEEYDE